MTPQTPQPGPLTSPPFPSLGPGRAGTWPFPSSLLTAAPGQGAAGAAATGRTNLSSIPWEPRTLRDLHGGPSRASYTTHQPASLDCRPCLATLEAPSHATGMPRPTCCVLRHGQGQGSQRPGVEVTSVERSRPNAFLAGEFGGGWRAFATCVRN